MEARSEGPGKGNEYTVWLPDARGGGSTGRIARVDPGAGRPHRVLVVDDIPDAAEMLADLLDLNGHEVVTTHSGAAALELAPNYRPDVVPFDIGMPGMNGYEMARRLRQDPALARTTLVALTGYGQEEDRERTIGRLRPPHGQAGGCGLAEAHAGDSAERCMSSAHDSRSQTSAG